MLLSRRTSVPRNLRIIRWRITSVVGTGSIRRERQRVHGTCKLTIVGTKNTVVPKESSLAGPRKSAQRVSWRELAQMTFESAGVGLIHRRPALLTESCLTFRCINPNAPPPPSRPAFGCPAGLGFLGANHTIARKPRVPVSVFRCLISHSYLNQVGIEK